MNKTQLKLWEKDEQEANTLSELQYVIDDLDTFKDQGMAAAPYYEGKWKHANGWSHFKKPLSVEWLECHFDKQYLKIVERLGWKKVDDPNNEDCWICIPKDQQWLPVPMGYNTNEDLVQPETLCQSVPIVYHQGERHSCLFTSVASAFVYMRYKNIAQYIVEKMHQYISTDAKTQWIGLWTLLQEKRTSNKLYISKYTTALKVGNTLQNMSLTSKH